jgi:hypothetical protein
MPEDVKMEKNMNPQIHDVPVGIRDLRNIKIYPLSLGDQFRMSDMVKEVLKIFFEQVGDDPELSPEVIAAFFELFKKNFTQFMSFIAPEEDASKLVDEMTNPQFSEIVEIVWRDNYEVPAKKLKGLFYREPPKIEIIESQLERPSPVSVDTTDTNLRNVTGNPS